MTLGGTNGCPLSTNSIIIQKRCMTSWTLPEILARGSSASQVLTNNFRNKINEMFRLGLTMTSFRIGMKCPRLGGVLLTNIVRNCVFPL